MPDTIRRTVLMVGCLAVALAADRSPFAQDAPEGTTLRMTAFAVNLSGVGRTRPQTLQIVIERWSTDEERKKLVDTLVEKGSEKLLDVVQDIKPRAGFIRTTEQPGLGHPVRARAAAPERRAAHRVRDGPADQLPGGAGQHAVDGLRVHGLRDPARSRRQGRGQAGAAATKVTYDKEKKQVELENYGQQPVRLTQVMVDK